MKEKFKVGDLVRGCKGAPYVITNVKMLVGKVIKVHNDDFIEIKILKHLHEYNVNDIYSVRSEYFKHINYEIRIFQDGKKIIAKNETDNNVGIAKCNPEDEFDFNTGAKLAFDRLMEKYDPINVGDTVFICCTGKMYTTNIGWVMNNVTNDELKLRYDYDNNLGFDKGTNTVREKFKVLIIKNDIAYIRRVSDHKCYVIGIDGLKKW